MIKKRSMREIGDREFPLEANMENRDYEHEDVGKIVKISPFATETLHKHRGKRTKIKATIVKYGQPVAYVVEIDEKVYIPQKKDILMDNNVSENVLNHTPLSIKVKECLKRWEVAKDYHKDERKGLEWLYFELAKVTDEIAIDAFPPLSFCSSTKKEDRRIWRIYIKDVRECVCVDVSSTLHGSSKSLQVYVFPCREYKEKNLQFIGNHDHWRRTLMWCAYTCYKFNDDKGFEHFCKRIRWNTILWKKAGKCVRKIKKLRSLLKLPPISIGFSDLRMSPKATGIHEPPSDNRPYSIISICFNSARNAKYLDQVVKHEMSHYFLTRYAVHEKHGEIFNRVSAFMGVHPDLRD